MIPTAESPDVFGHTIFCDDIRHEIDGKVSYIGSYLGGMQVHVAFPATIPKFAFGISLWQRRSVFQGKVALRVYLPEDEDDKPSIESQLDAPSPSEENSSEGGFIVMRAQVILAGMVLKAAGSMKVRALRDGTLFPLGSLTVVQAAVPKEPGEVSPD